MAFAMPYLKAAAAKGIAGANQALQLSKKACADGAPVLQALAAQGVSGAQQAYTAAAPVIADAARKGADLAQRGGRQAAALAKTGYRVAAPVVLQLGNEAKDVLANIPPPDIHFDVEAAKSALNGGAAMGLAAAASIATGCAKFAADILKLEIFRDFYQFLSIFFSSLKLPANFKTFFGNIAALASMGLTNLLSFFTDVKAALNPIMWFWIMFVLAFGCWIALSCEADPRKYAKLKIETQEDKDKANWKEINKKSMFRFKKVKYLLLAITTLYTPVTRNALQMVLCAPKYAYSKYECLNNATGAKVKQFYCSPQEDKATGTCVAGYRQEALSEYLKQEGANYAVVTAETCATYISKLGKYKPISTPEDCSKAALELKVPNYKEKDSPLSETTSDNPKGCYWDGEVRLNNINSDSEKCDIKKSCLCKFEASDSPTGERISNAYNGIGLEYCSSSSTKKYQCPQGKKLRPGSTTIQCHGGCDSSTCCYSSFRFLRESNDGDLLNEHSSAQAFQRRLSTSSAQRGYYAGSGATLKGNIYEPIPLDGYKLNLLLEAQYPICYSGTHWYMAGLSIVILIFFSIGFPVLMGKMIDSEKPEPILPTDPENPAHGKPDHPLYNKEVIFNDEGQLVEYTKEMFLLEVNKKSDSPFTTMYKGFEREWAKYKIYVMDLKAIQILFMTVATSNVLARDILTPQQAAIISALVALASTGVFFFFSWKTSPYVDDLNDRMEMVSKITLMITPALVMLSALLNNGSLAIVIGYILNISAALGNVMMIWLTVSAMPCCKTKLKKWRGTLDFSSTDGITLHNETEDGAPTLPKWDLDVERKRRIWKPFWNKVITSDKNLSGCLTDEDEIKNNGGKKYLDKKNAGVGPDGTTILQYPSKRFEIILEKLRIRGFQAFESGVMPLKRNEAKLRQDFQTMLEGPDVYCSDTWITDPNTSACKDSQLNSVNGFCRLEVDPYPYCVKLFWGGAGKDWGEIPSWGHHRDRLQELWNMQSQPDVRRMKDVRLKIRGAYKSGALLWNPFERDEHCTRTVDDGTDKDGTRKTKQEHYIIRWKYTAGKVQVKGDFGERSMEQGFRVSMYYADGEGVETSGSKRGTRHHNGRYTMPDSEMDINHSNYQYNQGSRLAIILGEAGGQSQQNANHVRNGMNIWNQEVIKFRKSFFFFFPPILIYC